MKDHLLHHSLPRRDASGTLRRLKVALRDDRGSATAEYAIATMAAVGFAGLLVAILHGDEVKALLTQIIRTALTAGV
ncbi:DUF4244 domain-containing protein [Subtercola sp. Z020]|uniref:DUF4244 domain-containing protein n=1 Tax=Subtercola sp. Z020 TaxID=2080582 RepID=UPI000CE84B12|nr:DUF4244 domain-containing protein [Subtercola sp. Z020]PPF82187.1 DUF4244 domain-containing protein [Subtercola sp. Z020]